MEQEAKSAVDITAAAAAAAAAGGLPGSPAPAAIKRGSGSGNPLSPPPRTPESRISRATVQSSPGGVVDRRQLFEGKGGGGDGSSSSSDTSTMPPPPTTPKSAARRPRSQSKTPAKRGTPKDVTAMRQAVVAAGGGGGSSEDGNDEGGGEDGEGGEGDVSVTPRKKKKAADGTVRTLSMTPPKRRGDCDADAEPETPSRSASKKGAFGRTLDGSSPMKENVVVPPEVKRVYALVNKATGTIGGNGSAGAIYGELTQGGMQKVVNVLKEEAGFDENSSFIDVGSGLGKPNFHVAQDPGVEISYGLELEEVRWELSISNHRRVLKDEGGNGNVKVSKHNLFFAAGDILECKTFDPFTHVYMFDIGFPPATLREIGTRFNNSQARYLVSYQVPKKVTEDYAFDVDHVRKLSALSLTGSGEGKTMHLYRRKGVAPGLKTERIAEVDPFFAKGVKLCREGGENGSDLEDHVEATFQKNISGGVKTRRSRRANP
eukprot:g6943.t1